MAVVTKKCYYSINSELYYFISTLGYYVIAFGELESKEGDVAVMKSPIFENIPEQCFHFHFTYNVIFYDYFHLQFGVVYK